MDEIQHAVVNIIPASENMEEGNIKKVQFQEICQSVVQSTEVESQLAKAHEMSWPTVMQDVQTMEAFGKGADTNNAIQSGVMDNSNEAQNSLQRTKFNAEDKSVATYANCEMQTMVPNHSTNATQTDFVYLQQTATQTERRNEDSTSTQTDVTNCEQKESQTNAPDVNSQEVQTEIKVVEEQMIQTETVPQIDSESQTDLTTENITTVDKIEIVQGIESFPMQTDADELRQMSPFKSDNDNAHGNLEGGDKSPDKDTTSEVDSNISLVSKSDEKVAVTVSAGLDMRVGEYKELIFPPVASGAQKPTQLQPPVQERSPSPIDLCTKPSNNQNKVYETHKRKSSTITVCHNPYDYY